MSHVRLKCLGCDALLDEGELFCLACGGVPFGVTPSGKHAVAVGPVDSLAFRKQTAEFLAERVPGGEVEVLQQALANRVILARGIDAVVAQALVDRLKKIPAVAQVVANEAPTQSTLGRLFGPIPLALYAAGLVGAVLLSPWTLLLGLGAGATLGVLRKDVDGALTQPPQLPPPPQAARALPALLPKLDDAQRELLTQVSRGSFALLAAADAQGLASVEVDGMGRAASEVLGEAIELSVQAQAGKVQAAERLREIAAAVNKAAGDLGPRALPERVEQKLLNEAQIVKEVADL